jgi:hypothetical protein
MPVHQDNRFAKEEGRKFCLALEPIKVTVPQMGVVMILHFVYMCAEGYKEDKVMDSGASLYIPCVLGTWFLKLKIRCHLLWVSSAI